MNVIVYLSLYRAVVSLFCSLQYSLLLLSPDCSSSCLSVHNAWFLPDWYCTITMCSGQTNPASFSFNKLARLPPLRLWPHRHHLFLSDCCKLQAMSGKVEVTLLTLRDVLHTSSYETPQTHAFATWLAAIWRKQLCWHSGVGIGFYSQPWASLLCFFH